MMSNDFSKEELGNLTSIDDYFAGYKYSHLAESIHHNKNIIVLLSSCW
jgi:general stress protein 26